MEEGAHFQWDQGFLDLFTMSELDSLATEVGLKQAMGAGFKAARAGRKPAFIAALLGVNGFGYQGTVRAAMRYPRTPTHEPAPSARDAKPCAGTGMSAPAGAD